MRKLRLLPLFILLLLCLCATAFATTIPGQQNISYITDDTGYVTTLTDDDTTTAWNKSSDYGVDLTLNLNSVSVGEIWIRSGYAYTQNWYNHYDRPDTILVTVYYQANRYTESYDSYRYRLTDAFRPNTMTSGWNSGYQRLLLPKKYTGVTKIELTIESVINGYGGGTGATISDIIVASGSHATATPKSYATSTPRPYVVYVTATPGPQTEEDASYYDPDEYPYVEYLTPIPEEDEDDSYAEYLAPESTRTPVITIITPKPTLEPMVEALTPVPTATPLVELITPTPTRVPVDYPSDGVPATLTKRVATRSGPGTGFDEPGSFFSEGDEVNVITKVYDNNNDMYWFQIEFEYKNRWYRVYTTESRLNIDPDLVPNEPGINDPLDTQKARQKINVSFGPGDEYAVYTPTVIHEGTLCDVYAIENGWVQIEYTDYGADDYPKRRGWVPLDVIYGD